MITKDYQNWVCTKLSKSVASHGHWVREELSGIFKKGLPNKISSHEQSATAKLGPTSSTSLL